MHTITFKSKIFFQLSQSVLPSVCLLIPQCVHNFSVFSFAHMISFHLLAVCMLIFSNFLVLAGPYWNWPVHFETSWICQHTTGGGGRSRGHWNKPQRPRWCPLSTPDPPAGLGAIPPSGAVTHTPSWKEFPPAGLQSSMCTLRLHSLLHTLFLKLSRLTELTWYDYYIGILHTVLFYFLPVDISSSLYFRLISLLLHF